MLKLAAFFLAIYSLALTLSPAARFRTWDVELRWSHWLGFAIWGVCVFLAHMQISRRAPDADPFILPTAALLAGWGILTIWRLEPGFGLRQALWLGFCAAVFLAGLSLPHNLEVLRAYKYIFLTGGLTLTALTLIFGSNPGGAGPRLWLGCCGLYLQPSEPLKLLLIVYLAAYFADRLPIQSQLLPLLLPTLFVTGLALAILLIQRDLGTASIFIFLYATLVYMASGKRRLLIISLGLLVLAGLTGYFFVDIIHIRLIAWLDPWTDPSGRSYQIIQSILAVANGGLLGRGPGMGSPGLVPVSHSDFIFTSIAEENGMLGSLVLLILLALISARGFLVALKASSNFQRLLAAGIAAYFGAQSILIIGGNLRLLPLTGVTLPFVSYGGSSLFTAFVGLLMLVQISNEIDGNPAPLEKPQPFLNIAMLLGVGFIACALTYGWWSYVRAGDLLNRTDNPRRGLADRYVLRGSLLDRQNRVINTTRGQPGEYKRIYLSPSFSPIAGYTHPVYGQAGLEQSMDPYLRGILGNPSLMVWWNHLLYGQPPQGINVRLTIDQDIQKKADDLLGMRTGALVLINAQTGEILAMASHPTYDANQLDSIGETLLTASNSPLLNRATQGLYPIESALTPFYLAEYGTNQPKGNDPSALFARLGFYTSPDLQLPVSPAQPAGTIRNLKVSPVQMASAISAFSDQGKCTSLQIVSAVETQSEGWVVLQSPLQTPACLPQKGVEQVTQTYQGRGNLFWEFTGSEQDKTQPTTWFLAGTLPNWGGTPLALVVVLEESSPALTRNIGENILEAAIRP